MEAQGGRGTSWKQTARKGCSWVWNKGPALNLVMRTSAPSKRGRQAVMPRSVRAEAGVGEEGRSR